MAVRKYIVTYRGANDNLLASIKTDAMTVVAALLRTSDLLDEQEHGWKILVDARSVFVKEIK